MTQPAPAGNRRAENLPAHPENSPVFIPSSEKVAEHAIPDEKSTSKWLVLAAVGTATFMAALDGSVVNTTLPVVTRYFNTDLAVTEWVVTVYLLVLGGMLLTFGRLGDLYGHKRVYLGGFVIFLFASALCGLSTSVAMLVTCRGIQALGAAMLAANSPAILTKNFPASQRGQALGLQATMTYLGLTIGPFLGGLLAGNFSWRAVFYINVPVCLIAIYLSVRFIASDAPKHGAERFDIAGAVLFLTGLVALMLGLNQGEPLGWTSPVVLGSLLAAGVLLTAFAFTESRVDAPMLDLSLFRSFTFSSTSVSAVLNYICIYVVIFLMPFYLNQGRQFSIVETGLLLTPMSLIMAIVAPISGSISDRIGARWPSSIGMAFLALGLFLLGTLNAATPISLIILYMAIIGLGTGIFISPNTSALMGAAPRTRQGIASGILATARNVGMVLGIGFAGAIFNAARQSMAGASVLASVNSPLLYISPVTAAFFAASGVAVIGIFVTLSRKNIRGTHDQPEA